MLVDRIEELLDAAGAEILFPVLPEAGLVIVGEIGVVGVKGEPGFRVVQLRPLIERDRASPVEGADAPSTGVEPSPDFRKGTKPGFRKPMSPPTSAKTKFWVGV